MLEGQGVLGLSQLCWLILTINLTGLRGRKTSEAHLLVSVEVSSKTAKGERPTLNLGSNIQQGESKCWDPRWDERQKGQPISTEVLSLPGHYETDASAIIRQNTDILLKIVSLGYSSQ